MNMFARFDENPAMTLWVIKETKRYGRTDARTDAHTDGQRENSIPPTNKVCGGLSKVFVLHIWTCLQGLTKIQQWLFELLRKQSVTDGRTHARTHGRTTWKQYTPTNKVWGGYKKIFFLQKHICLPLFGVIMYSTFSKHADWYLYWVSWRYR